MIITEDYIRFKAVYYRFKNIETLRKQHISVSVKFATALAMPFVFRGNNFFSIISKSENTSNLRHTQIFNSTNVKKVRLMFEVKRCAPNVIA
jgi:hypothetical protein